MITMMKKRLRSFFINAARIIASILLRPFKTCYLVFELERRTDLCQTYFLQPDGKYELSEVRPYLSGVAANTLFKQEGPAVVLVVVD